MRKVLVIAMMLMMGAGFAVAAEEVAAPSAPAEVVVPAVVAVVEVGNKNCPVCGMALDPLTMVKYEFEGMIYNFCSEGDVEVFKQDPQTYIQKVAEELAAAAAAEVDPEVAPDAEVPAEK